MATAPAPPGNPATTGVIGGLGVTQAQIDAEIAKQGGGKAKAGSMVPAYRIATAANPNDPTGEPLAGGLSEHNAAGVTTPPKAAPTMRDSDDVKLDIKRMTEGQLEALGQRLVAAHLLPEDWALSGGRDDLEKVWGQLVDRATDYNAANGYSDATKSGSLLTPEDMIDLYSGQSAAGKNTGSTTSTSISYGRPMTADGARRKLEEMMTGALGRAPTGKEADDFQAALNEAQANNPSTTVTTSSTDASGNSTSTSRASGGLDVEDFTKAYNREHVKNTDEYRHFQSATTYYQALLQAIKGPPV